MAGEPVKIGIVGTGFTIGIARSHVDAISKCEGAQLTAVYDVLPGRAEAFLKRHGLENIAICSSLEDLLAQVDAVALCVPNSYHAELAVKVLGAGKHVLVEKPFSIHCEEGQKALDASRAHPELVAMTCFNYREQAAVRYMREILESGALGAIRFVRQFGGGGRIADAENVNLEWRMRREQSGTGALADFGAHMIDLADVLLSGQCGKFVTYSALSTTQIPERYRIDPADTMGGKAGEEKGPVTNDDTSVFTALSESGALFTFMTSRINLGGNEFEIVGEKGALLQSSALPHNTLGMMLKGRPVPGQEKPSPFMQPVSIPERFLAPESLGMQHLGVYREFIDCIQTGGKPVRDFERGMFIQGIIDRFAQAAAEGRTITV